MARRKAGPALQAAAGGEVIAVFGRDAHRARDCADRLAVPDAYDDLDAFLAHPGLEAVYIATPPFLHAEMTERVAAAGKAVLCEKPMARSVAECRRMVAAARRHGVPLAIAYYRRAFPVVSRMATLLAEDRIGRVLSARVDHLVPMDPATLRPTDWRFQAAQGGGGVLMDIGSHRIDLLHFLLGPVRWLRGEAATQALPIPVDDAVHALLGFDSGAVATLSVQWNVPVRRDRLELLGTRGRLTVPDLGGGRLEVETADGLDVIELAPPAWPHDGLVANVNAHLLRGEPLLCSGADALETNRIMTELYRQSRARHG